MSIKDSGVVVCNPSCPRYCGGETFCQSVAHRTLKIRPRADHSRSVRKSGRKIKHFGMCWHPSAALSGVLPESKKLV